MNLAPTLGKQKWRSCSSKPTPRAAKLIAPKPPKQILKPWYNKIIKRLNEKIDLQKIEEK